MSFLNVSLLGGAAAVLAPLIIHLLNRTRFQTVQWGAMHLLDAAIQVNSRRIQWQSLLLLLLIRCLIPILLAVCLARPVLTSFQMAGADGGKSLLLMLDDSLSMDADDNAESTLLTRAKRELEGIVKRSDSAEISFWTAGSAMVNQLQGTTFNTSRVVSAIDQVRGGTGSYDLGHALMRGAQLLQSSSNLNRQLVLASDFQASQWRSLAPQDLLAIRNQMSRDAFVTQLVLLPIMPNRAAENLSVEIVRGSPLPLRTGETCRLAIRVINHGSASVANARVVFRGDDRDLASRTVSLPAGASEQLDFACEFSQVGWHATGVHVEDPAQVHGDDWAFDVIYVSSRKRVLIVDDIRVNQEFSGHSRYLQLALAPLQTDEADRNPFQIDAIDQQELTPERLAKYDAVILAKALQLSDRAAAAVEKFVLAGGGLLLFAGDEANVSWYNRHWHDQRGLLPMRFGDRRQRRADKPMKVASAIIQDETLSFFNSPSSGLQEFEFTDWLELSPDSIANEVDIVSAEDAMAEESSQLKSLLKFNNGDILFAEQKFGDGHVLQSATSCSDDWSNMPLKSAYVPLMQTLVQMLTQPNVQSANVMTGEAVEIRGPQQLQRQAAAKSEREVTIVGPEGQRIPLRLHEGKAVFDATHLPGLYRVEADQLDSDHAFDPKLFSASLSSQESDMQLLNAAELDNIAKQLGATVVASADEYFAAEQLRRDGREIWRWLLAGVLCLLLLELVVGQRITRGAL